MACSTVYFRLVLWPAVECTSGWYCGLQYSVLQAGTVGCSALYCRPLLCSSLQGSVSLILPQAALQGRRLIWLFLGCGHSLVRDSCLADLLILRLLYSAASLDYIASPTSCNNLLFCFDAHLDI